MALNIHQHAGWNPPRTHLPRLAVHVHDWLSGLMEKAKQEDACVASPPLVARDRVRLSVCSAHGHHAVATDRALYHQNDVFQRAVDDEGWARAPWEQVGRVTWPP